MTGNEPTLADALRTLSFHPSLEQLASFHEDRLAPEEAERLRQHIESCADCSEQSMEVANFLNPEEPPLDEAVVSAIWRSLSESLGFQAEESEVEMEERKAAPPPPPAKIRRRDQPQALKLAAGLLLAATVVSTGAWLVSQQEVARLEEGEVNVPVVAIDQAVRRGGEQGKEPQPVEVPPGAVLVLTPLRAPRDAAHQVLLSSADGETVWLDEGLKPTNASFLIRLPRDLEPGGIYHVRITPGEDQDFALRVMEPGPE